MNMNIKRILSSVLVAVMLLSAVSVILPVQAQAAHHSEVSSTKLTTDEVAKIVDDYQKAEYTSLEEMFQADLALDRLDYATNGAYSIYVNRYTGVLYYRNNKTGEMLSSNSYNFKGAGGVDELTSQVSVSYATISNTENNNTLYSSTWAAKYNQISVSKIDNGLRVSYAIGDTANRCLLPVIIEASEFENDILRPMFETLYQAMKEELGEKYAINYFDESGKYYNEETVKGERFLHTMSIRRFSQDFENKMGDYKYYMQGIGAYNEEVRLKVTKVEDIMNAINIVFNSYNPHNPSYSKFEYDPNTTPEITLQGYAVYEVKNANYSQMAVRAKIGRAHV